MYRIFQPILFLSILLLWCSQAAPAERNERGGPPTITGGTGPMIDLSDANAVRAHRPFLIAHRAWRQSTGIA